MLASRPSLAGPPEATPAPEAGALSLSPRQSEKQSPSPPDDEAPAPDSPASDPSLPQDDWVDPQPDHWEQAEAEANTERTPPTPTAAAAPAQPVGEPAASVSPTASPDPLSKPAPVLARRPPPQGSGLIAGGSSIASAGLLSVVVGTLLMRAAAGDENVRRAGVINVSTGAVFMGLGGVMIVPGVLRRRAFFKYARRYNVNPPPNGNGFFASGGLLAGNGALNMLTLIGSEPRSAEFNTTLAIAGSQVSAGLAAIVVGAVRRARYQRWVRSQRWSLAAR